nr:hypothetical protein [uncultured Psychroserpens sp.]
MSKSFDDKIKDILKDEFGDEAEAIYKSSRIIQYLKIKTKAADRGSKSRASYGNLFAIYVLVEDYLKEGFNTKKGYDKYEGAQFSAISKRQRELPFGSKLQNHALNHRLNQEFRKYNKDILDSPILRNPTTNRYWINENLIIETINEVSYNLASSIIKIVDAYVDTRRESFDTFIESAEKLKSIVKEDEPVKIRSFIYGLLAPNIDARIFEIVSYAILKNSFINQKVFFGYSMEEIKEEELHLYKTGRTNANDGGIDFVMKPLGRFFQVTETTDVRKYFLDIDKLEKFPITFVIKTEIAVEVLFQSIKDKAHEQYPVREIVETYMSCVEEIINIPKLKEHFEEALKNDMLNEILSDIIIQSKVEFNYEE